MRRNQSLSPVLPAPFIGFHLARRLPKGGVEVVGLDNLNDYYDVRLKEARLALLEDKVGFTFHCLGLGDRDGLAGLFRAARRETVVHLAAQAGVRYSLTNPHAYYVDSNLVGTLNILEGRATPACATWSSRRRARFTEPNPNALFGAR